MKKSFLIATASFLTLSSFGQNKTYLGASSALCFDIYNYTDNGHNLRTVPVAEATWGFNFRQEFSKNQFFETGLVRNYYDQGFGFINLNDNGNGMGQSRAVDFWSVPLLLGNKFNLYKEKVHLVPIFGASYNKNLRYNTSLGIQSGSARTGNDSVSYYATIDTRLSRHFTLLQSGIGLEFKILKTAIFSLNTSYSTGFKEIVQININYKTNNAAEPVFGKIFSNGESLSIGADLKLPFSGFCFMKH